MKFMVGTPYIRRISSRGFTSGVSSGSVFVASLWQWQADRPKALITVTSNQFLSLRYLIFMQE